MAKSIKLKNDFYWDSKSIIHNKKNLNELLKDSGWVDITLLHGEKQTTNSYYDPKYRKIGDLVILKGAILNVKKTATDLFQLPERF